MAILVVAAIVIAFYMAWNIGANDVANSMADAVGSKAVSIFWAVILAGICEFCGAVLVGSHVTNTVRKGIIDSQIFAQDPMKLAHGMICAMLLCQFVQKHPVHSVLQLSNQKSLSRRSVNFLILFM